MREIGRTVEPWPGSLDNGAMRGRRNVSLSRRRSTGFGNFQLNVPRATPGFRRNPPRREIAAIGIGRTRPARSPAYGWIVCRTPRTHEAQGFRQRELAGALTWDPVAGDRGPRLSLTRTLGVPGQGGADTPLGRGSLAGLAANEPGNGLAERRLEARFGYGLPAFGGRFTSTPQIAVGLSDAGRDYSLGWRLVRGGDTPDGSALELAVEARRRESASGRNDPPGHAVGVRMISRF